jgi:hypothetical protein
MIAISSASGADDQARKIWPVLVDRPRGSVNGKGRR